MLLKKKKHLSPEIACLNNPAVLFSHHWVCRVSIQMCLWKSFKQISLFRSKMKVSYNGGTPKSSRIEGKFHETIQQIPRARLLHRSCNPWEGGLANAPPIVSAYWSSDVMICNLIFCLARLSLIQLTYRSTLIKINLSLIIINHH